MRDQILAQYGILAGLSGVMKKHGNQPDRRIKGRFPMQLPLEYRLLVDREVVSGHGRTLNVGSGGVCFLGGTYLEPGTFVELAIEWPLLLDDACPIQLVIFGRILRSADGRSVSSLEKYEFRTKRRDGAVARPSHHDALFRAYTQKA